MTGICTFDLRCMLLQEHGHDTHHLCFIKTHTHTCKHARTHAPHTHTTHTHTHARTHVHIHTHTHTHTHTYTQGDVMGFVPSLGAIAIGHYSLHGQLQKEHFNFRGNSLSPDLFMSDPKEENEIGSIPSSVYKQLVVTLSYEGHCVIDATLGNGKCICIIYNSIRLNTFRTCTFKQTLLQYIALNFPSICARPKFRISSYISGVARNCQMGVLEKVGREYAPCAKCAGAHVSALLRGVWGSSPQIFFVLHALRLIVMQSRQRNVDEMKYRIANITMNIIVSLLSQAARMSRSSLRRGWRRGPQHSG